MRTSEWTTRASAKRRTIRDDGTGYAKKRSMMDVALSIMALVAGGVTLELFAASKAPLGYQDERGFHFGTEPQPRGDDVSNGNPS